MQNNPPTIFGIKIIPHTRLEILKQAANFLDNQTGVFHIVSLNPEILVCAKRDAEFKNVLNSASLAHVDGIGIKLAGLMRGFPTGQRYAGVDLMDDILKICQEKNKRVFFLGGKPNIAYKLACEFNERANVNDLCIGFEGYRDIKNVSPQEEKTVEEEIKKFNPQVVFVSFGSPLQEKWIASHKDWFQGKLVMGVGGAFDFLSRGVPRAPRLIRFLGGEWFFRLIKEPWRIKRQLNLLKFLWFVIFKK